MERRNNWRGFDSSFVPGRHLKLEELKREAGAAGNRYLEADIPSYPQPEFRATYLKHDTDQSGLRGIKNSCGFRASKDVKEDPSSPSLLWWSLVVGPEDLEAAERRFLAETFPERTPEQAEMQQSFLEKFATSPAFVKSSKMGSYRFTFPVEELLEAYREQPTVLQEVASGDTRIMFNHKNEECYIGNEASLPLSEYNEFCSGAQPMMKVFKTVLYKQEVMYVVLIHRPENEEMFSQYPVLPDDPGAICTFKDGRFIWRSQAMCGEHKYKMVRRREENQIEAVERSVSDYPKYYVWDHFSVAFDVDNGEVLTFDDEQLGKNVTTCAKGYPAINPITSFDPPVVAEALIRQLWPTTSD